jgi:hypothetical protein
MTRTAAQGGLGEPYHVRSDSGHPSDSGTALCGTRAYAIVSKRADLVPLDARCPLTGCFEAWPVTQAEADFDRAVVSPWASRRIRDIIARERGREHLEQVVFGPGASK